MKVLVVEDDRETAGYIAKGLRQHGHAVDVAHDGSEGLFLASGYPYDVLIVDRRLPKLDGLVMVRTLRAAGSLAAVLFLTTMGGVEDRVEGLEAGGDDYLVKPFAFSELHARINALARRPALAQATVVHRVADLEMDLLQRTVHRGGQRVDIQPREFKLLEFLMRNAGQIVTRTMLLEHVWDFHFDPKTNIVETHVSRLRSKIGRGGREELIHTVRGSGYVLRAPDQDP